MEVVEALIITSIAWLISIVLIVCVKECCRTLIPSEVCAIDSLGTATLASLIYADYWIISKFWQGVFINNELTGAESSMPVQSFFILFFFWFLEFVLIYLTLMVLIFTVGLLIFLCVIWGSGNERSIYHPISRCLGVQAHQFGGGPTGTFD